MDNMAYLQQISASSRPAAPKRKFSLNPKIFIFVGIAVAAIIFIAVISSMLGSVKDKERDQAMRLDVRTMYLLGALNGYANLVKASDLRTISTELSTHLVELNRDLLPMLTNYWGYKDWEKDAPAEILAEEQAAYDELIAKLENARLNGLLDRVFVREITLQIALLNAIQSEVLERTEKSDLTELLERSLSNIKELYTQFNEYSNRAT